ncbi:MAG: proline iminopeptidase-family hydrolase [Pseudomonadota bacterium]|jgi:proline iminopeptidase|nr:proline iminopeptidase-family hydrolase [Alphaproteobacteria bacterium]
MHSFFVAILLFLVGCATSTYKLPEAPVKQGYVAMQDGKLFYQIVGKGDPLIILHGGPGLDQGYLLPHMATLAKKHQVVFYDQRGSGRSTFPHIDEQHITTDQFVEDLESLRKALGFAKITLVGHSWGGFLAMKYAIKYSTNLNKLVVMNSLPITSSGIHDLVEAVEERVKPSAEEIEKTLDSDEFEAGDPDTVSRYYRLYFKHYIYNPQDLAKINMQLEPQGTATGVVVSEILEEEIFTKYIDLTSSLKKLKIPTLIIQGEQDVVPMHTAKEISKAIKGSKLVVLKQCGHAPFIEKPQEWLEVVEAFLKG